jgi:hypothetical protein
MRALRPRNPCEACESERNGPAMVAGVSEPHLSGVEEKQHDEATGQT